MKIFKSAGDHPTKGYSHNKRRVLMKLFWLAGILVSFSIGACDFRKVEAQTETNSKKENKMESIQSVTTIGQNIPPIDTVIPPQIQTATFALG